MREEEFGELKSDVKHLLQMVGQLSKDLKENTDYTVAQKIEISSLKNRVDTLESNSKKNTKNFSRTDLMWIGASFLGGSILTFIVNWALGKFLS